MGHLGAETAFGEVANHHRPFVHQTTEADGALRLRQHVAQARCHQRLADLVLDRRNGLGAKVVAVAGKLVEPKRPHDRVGDELADDLHPKGFIDQQSGQHQQGGAGHVQQRANGVGQDVGSSRGPQLSA